MCRDCLWQILVAGNQQVTRPLNSTSASPAKLVAVNSTMGPGVLWQRAPVLLMLRSVILKLVWGGSCWVSVCCFVCLPRVAGVGFVCSAQTCTGLAQLGMNDHSPGLAKSVTQVLGLQEGSMLQMVARACMYWYCLW
jgi:hypothetical protein